MQIAPCGMNCSLCLAYQREKKNCLGCVGPDQHKPKHCQRCRIKHCAELLQTDSGFCYACPKFPCKRLTQLDARYSTKYGMSMIQNLKTIQTQGLTGFIGQETKKWTCKSCAALLCVHRESCLKCGSKNAQYPKGEKML